MKTRLEEIRRMQQLAGVNSTSYRFLLEEADDKKSASSEFKSTSTNNTDAAKKALQYTDQAQKTLGTIPKGKGSVKDLQDADKILGIIKGKMKPEEYEEAKKRAEALKNAGGDPDKAAASMKDGKGGNKDDDKEPLNESLVATLILLLPTVLQAGGSLMNLMYQTFGISEEEKEKMKEALQEITDLKAELTKLKSERKKGAAPRNSSGDPQGSGANLMQKAIIRYTKSHGMSTDDYYDGKRNVKGPQHEDFEQGWDYSGDNFDPKLEARIQDLEDVIAGKDNEFAAKYRTKLGEKMKHGAHKLHSIYTAPIRGVLWVLGVYNSKKREKIANIIYAIGMFAYALSVGIAQYMKASLAGLEGVGEVIEVIMNGIKGGSSFADIFKSATATVV